MRSLDRKIALFCILSVFTALLSCKAQYHIQQAEKHREKALKKGAAFNSDTTYVFGDTIINTYWKDSIRVIEKTITNTEYIEGEIRYITKKDKRVERRNNKLEKKREFKLRKQEIKTERKRSLWFIWFILGVISTLLIKQLYNKYFRFYLRR